MDRDAEHLRLLSLFYYIKGGIDAAISCVFLIYIVMGLVLTMTPAFIHDNGHGAPPAAVGLIFTFIGSVMLTMGWLMAGLTIYAGRCLALRKHRVYCMVVGCVNCVFLPYGTILGVFTLIVLQRPTVDALFDQPAIPG